MNSYDKWLEAPYAESDRQAEIDETAIELRVDDLWDSLESSSLTAEKLSADWEILLNDEGIIINAVAYARKAKDPAHLLNIMETVIGARLRHIAEVEQDKEP